MSIFDDIYRENRWQNDESVSGNGSTLEATSTIRGALPVMFRHYGLVRIIDIPCGDYHWFDSIEWQSEIRYLGIDIVPDLIAELQMKYHDTTLTFELGDILEHPLSRDEPADLILVRDLFGHFPNWKIQAALKNIKAARPKYLLTTTFPEHHSTDDIPEGAWRPVNMAEYWGLGAPIELLNEGCTVPGFEDKSLGLWRIK